MEHLKTDKYLSLHVGDHVMVIFQIHIEWFNNEVNVINETIIVVSWMTASILKQRLINDK